MHSGCSCQRDAMTREQPAPSEPPVLDGKVRLEPHVLKRLLIGRGWTLKDFCHETEMQMRTVRKIFGGERVQMSTARSVAEEFGVTMLDIVDPAEYRPPTLSAEAKSELGIGEWLPGRALNSRDRDRQQTPISRLLHDTRL